MMNFFKKNKKEEKKENDFNNLYNDIDSLNQILLKKNEEMIKKINQMNF